MREGNKLGSTNPNSSPRCYEYCSSLNIIHDTILTENNYDKFMTNKQAHQKDQINQPSDHL